MIKKPKKRFYLDYGILIPYLILSIVGIIMVYSASSYNLMMEGKPAEKSAISQAIFFVIGLVAIMLIYKMKTTVFQNKKIIITGIFAISVLLFLTRFTSLGQEINGAKGWLLIGGISIQPAELLKIMLIWYLAYILARRQHIIPLNFKEATLEPIVLVSGLIFLVLIQPDAGGAAILILISAVMVLASGVSFLYTLLIGGGGIALSVFVTELIILTKGKIFPERFQYIYKRFAVFRNPFSDAFGDGHQMVNSYYAMFNGGLIGKGLGNSIQKKGFLPEAQTDFMFSIVIEELGLIVAILILLLLMFLILRIINVGIQATNPFNSLIAIGVGGMLLIQTFVNIGGITGIIPLTGVTFPFISQGGSSLISLSIAIGFVLNVRADELRKKYTQLEVDDKQETNGASDNVIRLPER